MGTLTKTFVILNLVFGIAFVTTSAIVLSQRTNWKENCLLARKEHMEAKGKWDEKELDYKNMVNILKKERETAKAHNVRLKDQLTDREETIKERDLNIERLESELTGANARADRLGQNVGRLTSALAGARKELASVKKDLVATRVELDERNTTVVGLRSQVSALNLKHRDLLHRFDIANARIDSYKRYADIVEKVAPGVHARASGIEAAQQELPPDPPIRATVRAVNTGMGLVVLNVGTSHTPPVKKGYRFLIHRGSQFVAAVTVVNVQEKMCATEVAPPTPDDTVIQVGDAAVTEF